MHTYSNCQTFTVRQHTRGFKALSSKHQSVFMSIVLKIFTIHEILQDVLKCRRAKGHCIHTNSKDSLTNQMISSIVTFNEANISYLPTLSTLVQKGEFKIPQQIMRCILRLLHYRRYHQNTSHHSSMTTFLASAFLSRAWRIYKRSLCHINVHHARSSQIDVLYTYDVMIFVQVTQLATVNSIVRFGSTARQSLLQSAVCVKEWCRRFGHSSLT